MMNGRTRRSKTVGPGLKMNRMVPNSRLCNDNKSSKDGGRIGIGRRSRVNLFQKIARNFEQMVEVASSEGIIDTINENESQDIQLTPEKIEILNTFQLKIIKESLENKHTLEMETLKKLKVIINAGKEIIDLDGCISEALDLEKSCAQEGKLLAIEKRKLDNEMRNSKKSIEIIDNFVDEYIISSLATIQRRIELLDEAEKKLVEIHKNFEKLSIINI